MFFRLPDNYSTLKKIDAFSVDRVLKSKKDSILPILNIFSIHPEIKSKIISQYSNIHLINWENIENTSKFWSEVKRYRDSAGNNPYEDLVNFALSLLSLPWSNAEVERVFSQVNLVKTKIRNRLEVDTLNAILAIR